MLSDGCLIKYIFHSPNEFLIEISLFYNDPTPISLPDYIPSLRINLIFPPMIKTFNRQGRNTFPFHIIIIFWFDFRKSLPKCKNIGFYLTLRYRFHHWLWGFNILIPFFCESRSFDKPTSDNDFLAVDDNRSDMCRLTP